MYWAPNTLIFAAIKSTRRQRQPTRTGIPKASVPPQSVEKKHDDQVQTFKELLGT